jgi:hypothetical protein
MPKRKRDNEGGPSSKRICSPMCMNCNPRLASLRYTVSESNCIWCRPPPIPTVVDCVMTPIMFGKRVACGTGPLSSPCAGCCAWAGVPGTSAVTGPVQPMSQCGCCTPNLIGPSRCANQEEIPCGQGSPDSQKDVATQAYPPEKLDHKKLDPKKLDF